MTDSGLFFQTCKKDIPITKQTQPRHNFNNSFHMNEQAGKWPAYHVTTMSHAMHQEIGLVSTARTECILFALQLSWKCRELCYLCALVGFVQ